MAQFDDWLSPTHARTVPTMAAAPLDRSERTGRRTRPLCRRSRCGWHNRVRLGRDHYGRDHYDRADTNDSSIDPHLIGWLDDVHADLDRARVRVEGWVVATHAQV